MVEPALGSAAGLGRWFVGGVVLLNAGVFQMWEVLLGSHSVQTPASVLMANPGHIMGH